MAMAVSSSIAATLRIPHFPSSNSTPRNGVITFPTRPRHQVSVKNSGDVSGGATEVESDENSIKAPAGSSSLISALNVERALRGIAITDADHYGRLGLQRGCSSEQVMVAYKNKLEEVEKMKEELDEEEVKRRMEFLEESYEILSSAQERRLYDWSLARSANPDKYVWPFEVDDTPKSKEDPPAQEPEDVGPTRLVGYFMLGWLILSFVLSIALNR